MGVPLGRSFGRLISPLEAQELVRRDQVKKNQAEKDAAAKERRERREMRHKWEREEAEFDRNFPNTISTVPAPSLSDQFGCAFIALLLFLGIVVFISLLTSLGA